MRFSLSVTGAGTAGRTISLGGASRNITIQQGFPFPPAAELAACSAKAALLADPCNLKDLTDLYGRFLANGLASGEAQLLGEYLFAALLGPLWAVIEAGTPAGGIAELELEIDPADTGMQSFPWEMLRSPKGFLATSNAPRFSLARIIPPSSPLAAPVFTAPFRVLFVVGSQLNAALRPGMELIGLLRRREFANAGLAVRYLGEASWNEFKDTVAEFRPSLVHMVCHGQIRPGSPPEILLLDRTPVAGGRTVTQIYPVTAGGLIQLMQQPDGWIPPIVILNACYTSSFTEAHLPFAASLVNQGVAMSIGMAGEVADRACQAFTLRFYQALLSSQPVTEATAQGRRAALLGYPELEQSIEWTRATLFLRKGAAPNITVPKPANLNLVQRAPQLRRIGRVPDALCARDAILQPYHRLAALLAHRAPGAALPNDPLLIAYTVTDSAGGVGKTRLLEEIAVRGITDGLFPVILRKYDSSTAPANLLDFALAVSDAMAEVREIFDLPFSPPAGAPIGPDGHVFTYIHKLAFKKFDVQPDLTNWRNLREQIGNVKKKAGEAGPATSDSDATDILDDLREDFAQLARDAKAKGGVDYIPILLLDDVHYYARVMIALLRYIGAGGLGTGRSPIPVILTYMTSVTDGDLVRGALRTMNIGEERQPELTAFQDRLEQRLAYGQLLLSWKDRTLNDRSKNLQAFLDKLQQRTEGRVKKVITGETADFIEGAILGDMLLAADLDSIIQRYP